MIDITLFSEKLSNFQLELPNIFERSKFSDNLYETQKFSFTAPQQNALQFKNISQLLFSQISNIIHEQFIKSVVSKLQNSDISYIDLTSHFNTGISFHGVLTEKSRIIVNKILFTLQENGVKCVMTSPRMNVEYFSDSAYFIYHTDDRPSLSNSYFSQSGKLANIDVFVLHTLKWQESAIFSLNQCRFDLKDFDIKFNDGQFFISYKSYFEIDNPNYYQSIENRDSEIYRNYIASKRSIKIDKLLNQEDYKYDASSSASCITAPKAIDSSLSPGS